MKNQFKQLETEENPELRQRKKAEEVCVQKAGMFPGVNWDLCAPHSEEHEAVLSLFSCSNSIKAELSRPENERGPPFGVTRSDSSLPRPPACLRPIKHS
ncbi:uncharacterized [Tachysurus ichikawai]